MRNFVMIRVAPVPLLFLNIIFFLLILNNYVFAGFGITPPYVKNTSLTRNSIYQQQILLVRSDPDIPLKATITVDAPEIEDWIEIVQGYEFELPKGCLLYTSDAADEN